MKALIGEHSIKHGAVLRFRHDSSNEWAPGIIRNITDDFIQIELPVDYIRNYLEVGNQVTCKYLSGSLEYTLEGIINSIPPPPRAIVEVFVKKTSNHRNMREYNRYGTSLYANVRPKSSEYGIFSVIRNISKQGMCVSMNEHIDINTEVEVCLFTESGDKISMQGIVVRNYQQENAVECGIRITGMSLRNRRLFSKMFDNIVKTELDSLPK